MTFQSDALHALEGQELGTYGAARARDIAFEAIYDLWKRRQSEGMKKKDIAEVLDCDPAWVTRNLRGPANWTIRTFGAFAMALKGEIEIRVVPLEEPIHPSPNYHAYAEYPEPERTVTWKQAVHPKPFQPLPRSASNATTEEFRPQ